MAESTLGVTRLRLRALTETDAEDGYICRPRGCGGEDTEKTHRSVCQLKEIGRTDQLTCPRRIASHIRREEASEKKKGKIILMVGFLHKSALASSDHSAHCAAGQLEVIQTGSERTRIQMEKLAVKSMTIEFLSVSV